MRKRLESLDGIKSKIMAMSGKTINMRVCRGRKQVKKYCGVIENTFPSVFVVRICPPVETASGQGGDCIQIENTASITPCLSYSYNDVLCGEVQIDEVS
jgi:uncharacterized protein Veg